MAWNVLIQQMEVPNKSKKWGTINAISRLTRQTEADPFLWKKWWKKQIHF